jgi:hypothetical protein
MAAAFLRSFAVAESKAAFTGEEFGFSFRSNPPNHRVRPRAALRLGARDAQATAPFP